MPAGTTIWFTVSFIRPVVDLNLAQWPYNGVVSLCHIHGCLELWGSAVLWLFRGELTELWWLPHY